MQRLQDGKGPGEEMKVRKARMAGQWLSAELGKASWSTVTGRFFFLMGNYKVLLHSEIIGLLFKSEFI